MIRIILLTAIASLLIGCEPATLGSEESIQLAARSDAWEDALNRGDVDALVAMYTPNARVMSPNKELASGTDAVKAEFGGMVAAGLAGEITSVEARTAGDIGYNIGLYTLGDASGKAVDRGKFIEIWRKGSDGRWRISNDIFNSDLPASGHPAKPERHQTVTFMHRVADPDKWVAAWAPESKRRMQFRRNGAKHVHAFQNADDPAAVGLVVAVDDMDKFMSFLESPDGLAAAEQDTVQMDTLRTYREIN